MIKVYFESGRHAELVATFESESVYMACLPILEVLASEQRMIVTENIEIDIEMDLQYQKAHEVIEEAEWEYEMSKIKEENNSVADDTENKTN